MTFLHSKYNPKIELSPKEMLEISQEITQEFAPDFSIKKPEPVVQCALSAAEMLEISEEIRLDFAPKAASNAQELVLLPVDPDHLYAYWNLGDEKVSPPPKTDPENQLTLRVYPEPGKNAGKAETVSWFDVAVADSRAQQSVFLSMRSHEAAYHATIGKCSADNSLAPFACSNIIHVPPGKLILNQAEDNQIIYKSIPFAVPASRETSLCGHNSASGQGNKEQLQ
jgi:hypothetical protein